MPLGPYFNLLFFLAFSTLIGVLFYIMNNLNNFKENTSSLSAFECGIENSEMTYSTYSFYCYYYLILFVLFDVELCCLLPLIEKGMALCFFLLLLVFLLSTLVEMFDGVLNWVLNIY